MFKHFFIVIIFITTLITFAQEQNISGTLKLIENGNLDEAKKTLQKFQEQAPNDPSVKFLKAVLSDDGNEANTIYEEIVKNHPNSNYADASLYRIFSYYYAKGIYGKAEELKTQLRNNYPSSPYLKAVDRTIPDSEEEEYITQPATTTASNTVINKPTNSSFHYTIQAGAFLNNNNARRLKETFEQDGYDSDIFTKDIGGSIFNVVSVGKFKSSEDAEEFLYKLKSDYNLVGRIIPLN